MMIIEQLKNWKGTVSVNGIQYPSIDAVNMAKFEEFETVSIVLAPKGKRAQNKPLDGNSDVYRITVKQYMTKPASPDFDFMAKWNNNVPMPLRTMTGTVEKETRGMVYMKLHGEGKPTVTCMRCGRELTNPISRKYGIGPECITKIPALARFAIEDAEEITEQLVNVTWEGWIIKSAIVEKEGLADEDKE